MAPEELEQKQEEPAGSPAGRRVRGVRVLLIGMPLLLLAGGLTGFHLWRSRPKPDFGPTRWPTHREFGDENRRDFDRRAERSREQMEAVAQALKSYRDREGGGLRWPDNLQELIDSGALPADFDLAGPLSGQTIRYLGDPPAGQDASRWVLAADCLVGKRRTRHAQEPLEAIVAATIILGDGSVRYVEGDEAEQYAGLQPGGGLR